MSLPLLAVGVIPGPRLVRVVAAGELDLSTAPLLRDQLDDVLGCGWLDVAVDLRETTFADSAALHVLLDAHAVLADFGGALTVIVDHGPIAELLEVSQAGRTLGIAQTGAAR